MTGPRTHTYRPGTWFGVIGERATVILPPSEKARVSEIWALVDEGAGFDETLDALIANGLRDLPGFVLLSENDGATQVVVRGPARVSLTAPDGDVEVAGSSVTTWVERVVEGVTALTVVVDETALGDAEHSLTTGLVRLSRLSSGDPSSSAAAEAPSAHDEVPGEQASGEQGEGEQGEGEQADETSASSYAGLAAGAVVAGGAGLMAADSGDPTDSSAEDAEESTAWDPADEDPADEDPADEDPADEDFEDDAAVDEAASDAEDQEEHEAEHEAEAPAEAEVDDASESEPDAGEPAEVSSPDLTDAVDESAEEDEVPADGDFTDNGSDLVAAGIAAGALLGGASVVDLDPPLDSDDSEDSASAGTEHAEAQIVDEPADADDESDDPVETADDVTAEESVDEVATAEDITAEVTAAEVTADEDTADEDTVDEVTDEGDVDGDDDESPEEADSAQWSEHDRGVLDEELAATDRESDALAGDSEADERADDAPDAAPSAGPSESEHQEMSPFLEDASSEAAEEEATPWWQRSSQALQDAPLADKSAAGDRSQADAEETGEDAVRGGSPVPFPAEDQDSDEGHAYAEMPFDRGGPEPTPVDPVAEEKKPWWARAMGGLVGGSAAAGSVEAATDAATGAAGLHDRAADVVQDVAGRAEARVAESPAASAWAALQQGRESDASDETQAFDANESAAAAESADSSPVEISPAENSPAESSPVGEPADAPVARLKFSSGDLVPVAGSVVVGRAPNAAKVSAADPTLVIVPSPNNEISSTHVEIRPGTGLDLGLAVATDLNSTNGTMVIHPGLGPRTLRAGIAEPLFPGSVVDLGDGLTIKVEAPSR